MPDTPSIVWWMLTGVFGAGFVVISALLSHWFRRIESTLTSIWKEIKESRNVEGQLRNEVAAMRARCDERHK